MGAKHAEFRDLITAMFRERHKHPHLTVNLLRQHWADILGPELAERTYPARMAGQTLWINALDASWAYQLQFMKHELLESVQVFMGTADITELRFKQGALHSASEDEHTKDTAASTVTASIAPAAHEAADEAAGVRDSDDTGAPCGMDSGGTSMKDTDPGGMATKDTDPDGVVLQETGEEAATATTAAIADDCLRNSFSRWARVKKRKTHPGA
jgi:hypothetical protein